MGKPACMTDHEWAEWMALNQQCRTMATSPCADCTPAFRDLMVAEQSCDGELDAYMRRELLNAMKRDTARLAARIRAAYLEGLAMREVAALVGVNENTVRKHVRAASGGIDLRNPRNRAVYRGGIAA
jgi:DNA-directed RNA polymerase specialized sigma24 family protein